MRFQRNELLLGEEVCHKLKDLCVMIVGIGGVGGYAAESIVRMGVGKVIIIDKDDVDITNINRQIMALSSTVGLDKVEVMKQRLLDINPELKIIAIKEFFDEKLEYIFDEKIDYVLDAIDTLSAKWQLIKMCIKHNTKFISCTGMANRINPMEVKIMRLDKTSVDPICKILRNYARKDQVDMKKINVVVSLELPKVQDKIINENGQTRKEMMPPASIMLVPSVAGITMAYYVLNDLLNLD